MTRDEVYLMFRRQDSSFHPRDLPSWVLEEWLKKDTPWAKTCNLRFQIRDDGHRTLRILQQEVVFSDGARGWIDVPAVES